MTQGLSVRQLQLRWKWGWGGGYLCSFATCELGHAGAHPQTGLTVDPLPAWSEKVFFFFGGGGGKEDMRRPHAEQSVRHDEIATKD